jgi:transcription elongation factor GreA
MTDRPEISDDFQRALDDGDLERVEELWLEALDDGSIAADQLLEVRRLLWKKGHKTLARTLLELLAETLEARQSPAAALAALKEQVRLTDKPDGELLDRLQSALIKTRANSPSLDKVVSKFQLTAARRPIEVLEEMERWLDHDRDTVVEVVGQGVGRVVDANLELGNVKVDVGGSRPVSVPFGAVSRYIKRLEPGDFRREAVENPESLKTKVKEHPGEALAHLLESLGEPADVAAIKSALAGLVPNDGWNSWWTKARKHPRLITSGSGSRLRYTVGESAEATAEALLDELRSSAPEKRLAVARRVIARGPEPAEQTAVFLLDTLPGLQESDPGLAWETTGVLASLAGHGDRARELREELITTAQPLQLLSGIQDRSEREAALKAFWENRPELWTEIWSDWLLHEANPALLDHIATELDAAGESDSLDAALEAVFRNHPNHPQQFVWACEAMVGDQAPESLRRKMTPSLLEKIPDALSRSEFGPIRGRVKTLLDGGQVAVRLLLESATPQQADRFASRIGRLSGVEPQRVKMIEQAAAQSRGPSEETAIPLFVATKTAVEAKREELKQLLEVEIPKTLKGINAAAAEGDLRENFEYHMLRDRQELQSAKAAKIQQDLGRVRILEPGTADTSSVNIGTVVHFTAAEGDGVEPVTILGAWDADVDRRVFANGSGVAEGLLGKSVGDAVDVAGVTATIEKITAWNG